VFWTLNQAVSGARSRREGRQAWALKRLKRGFSAGISRRGKAHFRERAGFLNLYTEGRARAKQAAATAAKNLPE